MKHLKMAMMVLIVLLSTITFRPMAVQAEDSMTCDRVDVAITLQEDGTAAITESWLVTFDGDFSRMTRTIPRSDDYTISDLTVRVDQTDYKQLDAFDDSRPAGYFAMVPDNRNDRIEIYFDNPNGQKTFQIIYKAKNAVLMHQDVAEFYWKIIGTDVTFPIEKMTAAITLPDGARMEDIKAWAHGPLNGYLNRDVDQLIALDVDQLAANTFVEIRLAAPLSLFPAGENFTGINALDDILVEEQGFAAEANAARDKIKRAKNLQHGFRLAGIGAILVSMLFKKKKKTDGKAAVKNKFFSYSSSGSDLPQGTRKKKMRRSPTLAPEYYRELPSDRSPAEVIYLAGFFDNSRNSPHKFSATLLDLCQKRFILVGTEEEQGFLKTKAVTFFQVDLQKDTTALQKHESVILDLIATIGGGDRVSMQEIEKYLKAHVTDTQAKLKEAMTDVENKILLECGETIERRSWLADLFIGHGTKYAHWVTLAVSVILLIEGFSQTDGWSIALGFFLLFLFFFIVYLSVPFLRLNQAGEDEATLWLAFKRFLHDFTTFKERELPELSVWGKYIVYAVALGESRKILSELPHMYPDMFQDETFRYSYLYSLYYMDHGYYRFNEDQYKVFDSFGDNLNNTLHYSSGSGSGSGGFSGGGGGGGGGGGAGFD